MTKELLSIKDVIEILKKRILLIAIIIVISVASSVFYSYYILQPQYKTTTKLFIGKDFAGDMSQHSAGEVQMYQKLIKSYAGIALSEDVIARAVEKADLDMSASQILGSLSAVPGEEDQFLILTMITYNKEEGKEVLEAVIDELIATSRELIPNGSINVLTSPKVPEAPFAPNRKMNVLVAFAIGLILSVTLSLFLEYLDSSVKNKEEIEKLLGVSVIGMVPEYNEKDLNKQKEVKRSSKNKVEEGLDATY